MFRKSVLSACVFAALTWSVVSPAAAQNDSPTKDIFFTFSESVTVPNMTLPAGKYLFRHVGPNTGRTTLQISNADTGKLQTTIMTVQAARSVAPQRPEIRFLETAANTPPAIATWWYPGQTQGWEFIYPRQQATTLAKTAKQPILTTKEDVPADKMTSSDLVRMEPSGSQSAYSDSAAPAPMSVAGTAQRGEFADEPAASARQSASASGRTELPKTASNLPLLALFGFLACAAGVVLGLVRRLV